MKKNTLFIAILSLTLFLPGVLAIHAQAADLKFGHVGAPGSLFTISVEEFAKRVNAEVDGYQVVAFGSSQLGKDRELLRKLKLGTVDFCLPSTVMSSVASTTMIEPASASAALGAISSRSEGTSSKPISRPTGTPSMARRSRRP